MIAVNKAPVAEIETESEFHRDVVGLINELARPAFVFRMARGSVMELQQQFPGLTELEQQPQKGYYRSAQSRMEKAAQEIDDIVRKYIAAGSS